MFIWFLYNTFESADRGITPYCQERQNICNYNALRRSNGFGQEDIWFPYKTLSFHPYKSSTELLKALNFRFSRLVSIDSTILVLFMRFHGFNDSDGIKKPSEEEDQGFRFSRSKPRCE